MLGNKERGSEGEMKRLERRHYKNIIQAFKMGDVRRGRAISQVLLKRKFDFNKICTTPLDLT